MPKFIQLTDIEKRALVHHHSTIVISPKQQLFLEALGLDHFIKDAAFQKELYNEAKRNGLNKVKASEMANQDWRVQNALVLAFRRTLWS